MRPLARPRFKRYSATLDDRPVILRSQPLRLAADDALHHAQAAAVLDHACALPQGDGWARPAFAGGLVGRQRKFIIFNAGIQPQVAGGQLIGFGWEARRDEPGRQGTLQHAD
jgi:hypothetical protein